MDNQYSNKPMFARLMDNLIEERCTSGISSGVKNQGSKSNRHHTQYRRKLSQNTVETDTTGSYPMLVDFGESTVERPLPSRRRSFFSSTNRRSTLDTQESDFAVCHVHRYFLQRRKTDALHCKPDMIAKPVHEDASAQLKKITDCGELLVDWGEKCDDEDENHPIESAGEQSGYQKQSHDRDYEDDDPFVIRCTVQKNRMSSITITDDFEDQLFGQYNYGDFNVDAAIAIINELRERETKQT